MSELSDDRNGTTRTRSRLTESGHGVAVVGILIGVAYLVLGLARGEVTQGVIGLGVMVVYVALLVGLRRRSEAAQLLGGRPSDERQAQVLLQASALSGQVLAVVVIAAFLVSLALESRYAVAFGALGAIGGFTFIGATVWFSRHR